jgi:ABC-type nitrate/sulfonate/bicarbonate transport system substrate-binding protein
MRILPSLLILLLAVGSAVAADPPSLPDPDSPACQQATDAMVAAREAAARNPQQQEAFVQARRKAARLCLGQADLAGPDQRQRQALVVPPVVLSSPRLPPAARIVAPPLPAPQASQRPSFGSNCDPGGCWDASGNRLTRSGSLLIGPRGACTQHGTLVLCP